MLGKCALLLLLTFGLSCCLLRQAHSIQNKTCWSSRLEPSSPPFPWLVLLVDERISKSICSGTLISPNYIVTEAPCFPDNNYGHLEVLSGLKKGLWDPNEPFVQKQKVRSVVGRDRYNSTTYGHSLVAVELEAPFTITDFVTPACLDTELKHPLNDGQIGLVVDVNGSELEIFTLNIINYKYCADGLNDANVILTEDKFCARNQTRNIHYGSAGSGFLVKIGEKWFLKGLLSLGINLSNDSNKYQIVALSDIDASLPKILSSLKTEKNNP